MHALHSPCTRKMGLHQRHIGMTGTMNSPALYSLTQYIGLCTILFQYTKSNNYTVLVKCTDSLSYLHSLLSPFLHQCLCAGGGGGGGGGGETGRGHYMLGNSCSCSPSKRKAQPM